MNVSGNIVIEKPVKESIKFVFEVSEALASQQKGFSLDSILNLSNRCSVSKSWFNPFFGMWRHTITVVSTGFVCIGAIWGSYRLLWMTLRVLNCIPGWIQNIKVDENLEPFPELDSGKQLSYKSAKSELVCWGKSLGLVFVGVMIRGTVDFGTFLYKMPKIHLSFK